ncbi:glycosyltransferase family 4 protein [Porphyromonas gulae]|uniref:glycosyltransferase family 4 protein n=1 Tax=Porphyromonas gulae TaxID=111105 RepID=UPI00052B9A5F|nr:glycosyltransferase family 4 protein [Porphyromonas gulae]KGN92496.1 hypothetical protein HQ46_00135 [Porphyromonas gulae]
MNLFIVCNIDSFLLSHRLPIALEAIKRGWEVTLLAADTGYRKEIESYGIYFIEIPFARSGTNPVHETKCIYKLFNAYKQGNPDIIHHVGIKAIILGCAAAKLANVKTIVNAVSGFGQSFTQDGSVIIKNIVSNMLRLFGRSKRFHYILQNPEDYHSIQKMHLVPHKNLSIIKGSGVSLSDYQYTPPPNKCPIRILFSGRMVFDKGIKELLSAAHNLRDQLIGKVVFILAGYCDHENKTGISERELRHFLIDGYIEWIGFKRNIKEEYQNSDIVVLPSYREGLPKSLIDAAAIGRPIITTNAIGCKECVIDGYNGRMIPVKSVKALESTILELVKDEKLRLKFGKNSRILAEKEFSIDKVIKETFDIYNKTIKYNL